MKNTFRSSSTRSKLDITLNDFAPFLGVSTSLLSMSEAHERQLSGRGHILAICIESCLYAQTETGTESAHDPVGQQQLFKKRQQQCLNLLRRAEAKLLKMKEKEACQLNMIRVSNELLSTIKRFLPDFQLTEFEENWLKDYGKFAKNKLKACGKVPQQLLQVKIDALKHEIGLLQPLLEEQG